MDWIKKVLANFKLPQSWMEEIIADMKFPSNWMKTRLLSSLSMKDPDIDLLVVEHRRLLQFDDVDDDGVDLEHGEHDDDNDVGNERSRYWSPRRHA